MTRNARAAPRAIRISVAAAKTHCSAGASRRLAARELVKAFFQVARDRARACRTPILRLSTLTTAMTSTAVPVRKHSSAI